MQHRVLRESLCRQLLGGSDSDASHLNRAVLSAACGCSRWPPRTPPALPGHLSVHHQPPTCLQRAADKSRPKRQSARGGAASIEIIKPKETEKKLYPCVPFRHHLVQHLLSFTRSAFKTADSIWLQASAVMDGCNIGEWLPFVHLFSPDIQ